MMADEEQQRIEGFLELLTLPSLDHPGGREMEEGRKGEQEIIEENEIER